MNINWDRLNWLVDDLCTAGDPGDDAAFARKREFNRLYPAEIARIRQDARLEAVSVNGSRQRGAQAGYFKYRLSDGTYGFPQRRLDDCLQSAISTVAQIPMPKVVDFHIDRQLLAGKDAEEVARIANRKLVQWLEGQGLTMMVHPTPPRVGRWIGVELGPDDRPFNDHCMVIVDSTPIFSPTHILPPHDFDSETLNIDMIAFGLTLEKR